MASNSTSAASSASPEATAGQSIGPHNNKEEAAEHIKNQSLAMIEASNRREFRRIANTMLAPNLGGFHQAEEDWNYAFPQLDLATFIEEFQRQNPDYYTDVEDVTATVDDSLRNGTVWIVRTDTGCADNVRRETVMWLTWVRTTDRNGEQKWLCTDYKGIRSFPFWTIDALRGGGLPPPPGGF